MYNKTVFLLHWKLLTLKLSTLVININKLIQTWWQLKLHENFYFVKFNYMECCKKIKQNTIKQSFKIQK